MTPPRLMFATSAILLVAAVGIGFWPVRYEMPPAPVQTLAPISIDISGVGEPFDRSELPAPKPETPVTQAAPPPPDPAFRLKRFQYLGMAASGDAAAGVFTDGGTTQVLRRGDTLEGYSLTRMDENSAAFTTETGDLVLQITSLGD